MAKERAPRAPRIAPAKSPPDWRKVTLYLPRATAKRLHQLAIERETTIGKLAAPAIRAMLAGSCFSDKAGALAIAEGTGGELAGEAKAS